MYEPVTTLDTQKRMRWDGRSSAHYEVWYSTMNQLDSGAGFWIRYVLVNPRRGKSRVQVWFTSFVPHLADANVAVAQTYPIDQFDVKSEPFSLRMGPSSLESGRMTGMIEAEGAPVTWDLVFEPVTDSLQYLPESFYKTSWVSSKLLIPHPFLLLGGKIQIRDHSFILNNDPGHQGHVWGSRHAAEWIWFHCSSFVREGGEPISGYITGITAQQHLLGRLLLPPLSFGHLVWNENHLQLRPAMTWKHRWQGTWKWTGKSGEEDVSVSVQIPWSEMVLAEYEDPTGRVVYCHHTDRADCLVQFRAPRQPPRLFRSTGMAHAEIGSRTPNTRVMRRVLVQTW